MTAQSVSLPSGRRSLILVLAVAMIMATQAALPTAPAKAATNTLTLSVISARTEPRALGGAGVIKGDPVTEFKYIINVDNTGNTAQRSPAVGSGCSPQDAGYPDSCDWPSIAGVQYPSPIYTHGDQSDFGAGIDLPDGKYLISVLADGYKLDGEHFTVPLDTSLVTVELQPTPLPDSTLRAFVFADIAPTNGTPDIGDPGLANFVGHITDYLGEVQTDVYGNPLCTTYLGENLVTHVIDPGALDGDMLPVVDVIGGECVSDSDGLLTIPHLGSNRYTLVATPPDGSNWIQTTTLEGNHDWDTWLMEGSTGYDTEFVLAGEPVPQPIFGYAPPMTPNLGGSRTISGEVVGIKTYTPPKGGAFNFWGGHVGTKVDAPIKRPWLSLADLQAGDVAVWVGQGDVNGAFTIPNVPDGNYTLSWWDEPQNYNLNFINVTVSGGNVDMGNLPLNGWWTKYEGYVFNDLNRNGVKDAGEPGVPNFTLTMRRRENTLMDRGQNTATTDSSGYYLFESAYPLGEWTIMEAYHDLYYTTGITYQADNQPTPTTVLGAGVDVSVLNIIGLAGRMDWGVHYYDPAGANGIDPRNGGIVGTVSYDTTRNEFDPQYAATEDWQPGISGLPVKLWRTVLCGTNPGTPCDAIGVHELAPDGSLAKGALLNSAITENWTRPTGCTARDVDGNPLVHGVDEKVLVLDQETDGECIESFMQGVQFGPYPTDQGTASANFGAAVDGNYGFGDGCTGTLNATDPGNPICSGGTFEPLLAGDYLVEVAIPNDASGTPMYIPTREEDINVGNGNQIIPQIPPPACAGPLHTVDVAGLGTDGYPANTTFIPGVTVPASSPTVNATFVDIGGSPYEGTPKPLCDTKLVSLSNGKSIAPIFNIFTDVPIPGRLRGFAVDDVNFSADPRSTMYGEKTGLPFMPIGIYDFTNRLVTTIESDFNGVYEVLLPSTNHISCPTPAGVCANMYRFVANDPGIPGRLNPNYNPRYRTIATEFEAYPGMIIPTDLAPTQVGLTVEAPGTGVTNAVACTLDGETPQLLAVSQPYVNNSGSFTINGIGFGAGGGQVTLDDTIMLPTTAWSNTQISVTVSGSTPAGPHQLKVTASNGQSTVNGLTFHVRDGAYMPNLYEVGPGRTYATIQDAIDAAYVSNGDDLVVVYPGNPDLANPRGNPRGAYYENLIVYSPIKLQGVGPGGFQGNTFVPGSIIDAGAFGGDTVLADNWRTKVGGLSWDGYQTAYEGQAIYVLASENANNTPDRARQFTESFKASIDGFDIRGGDQQGFPGNINDLTGGPTGLPPFIQTQGGAIFANAYARHLQITNNVVENNGGAYGTIRIGTPDLLPPDTEGGPGGQAGPGPNHNENIRIANNRVIANGGTNLAGGIGIFRGADNYEVAYNDICGNFSVEYGGGLTVYGRSPNGQIHHNRIYFNGSNDEGGGIMIAGELPTTAGTLSPGSGPVDIFNNQIQANIANDDGGGIRFLMAGNYPINVYNNFVVNNVSTHEGGGIGINDTPDLRVFNNTIMKNLTTSTALTSNGQPYPAGVSTSANSAQLQATLPGGAPAFSNPLLFNNIFWDNRAGTRAGTTVTGIGVAGDASPIDNWDIGVADGTGVLAPTNSVIQQNTGTHPFTTSPTNSSADPVVVATYDVSVGFNTWRQNAGFVDATLVAFEAPPNLLGDYHLQSGSPAINLGAASKSGVTAPSFDIDDEARPADGGFDSGADEFGAAAAEPVEFYFSTAGNSNPPGVGGSADNADIYNWDGADFSRTVDATAIGLPGSAAVDALMYVDSEHFFVSLNNNASVPGLGTVQDEDIIEYDGGSWSIYFDGTARGLGSASGQDIDAIDIVDGVLYFSTVGSAAVPGVAGPNDDADVYSWDGATFSRVFDASSAGLPGNADVDGLEWVDADNFYVTFNRNDGVNVPGIGVVGDEDVVVFAAGDWALFFDGAAEGLTADPQDMDAFSFVNEAPPPLPTPDAILYFSTISSVAVPGVPGPNDDADVYSWDGAGFARFFDGSAAGLPGNADIDAVLVVDADTLYMSFAAGITVVPGVGNVFDEDVVLYDGGAWSMYFDGSDVGLGGVANEDVDAFDILADGSVLISTRGYATVPGFGGFPDEDLMRCSGGFGTNTTCSWSRYLDGGHVSLSTSAEDVDGVSVSGGLIYLSTVGNFSSGGLSGQDEDVFFCTPEFSPGGNLDDCTGQTMYFNGSANGVTNDLDAIDVP